MIRICALDFLNRDSFESDVKLADGKVIISAGEKTTPELILMLYFKEIYVDAPLPDVVAVPHKTAISPSNNIVIEDFKETELQQKASDAFVEPPLPFDKPLPVREGELDVSAPFEKPASVQAEKVESATPIEKAPVEHPEIPQEAAFEKAPKAPEINLDVETPFDKSEDSKFGSHAPSAPQLDLEKSTPVDKFSGGVDFGEKYMSDDNEDLDNISQNGKSPVAPQLDLGETDSQDVTPEKEEPVRILKYDENLAKEVAENAVKLARDLHIPEDKVLDIEKAAMLCDMGLDNFSIEDLRDRNFEQKKARASYEKALKRGIYSNEILEIVKCHAKPYVSENFDLNHNIPSGDILHIACMYGRYIFLGRTKEQALLKMLEQGGNEYNIFALHKFLRLMRNG